MTITDEAAVTLARDEAAVTLARDTVATLGDATSIIGDIAAMLEATAEWADDAIAGGVPPKWVIRQQITALRLIAGWARGEPVTV